MAACHADDRGSIPRRGERFTFLNVILNLKYYIFLLNLLLYYVAL